MSIIYTETFPSTESLDFLITDDVIRTYNGTILIQVTGYPFPPHLSIDPSFYQTTSYLATANNLYDITRASETEFLLKLQTFDLETSLDIYPLYNTTLPTLTGYSPLKSIYPENTGTIFSIKPSAQVINYTTFPVKSAVYFTAFLEELTSFSPEETIYNTLTTFRDNNNDLSIFHDQYESVYPEKVQPFTIYITLSSFIYPYIIQKSATKQLTFVDPPIVNFELKSPNQAVQDGINITEPFVTFEIDVNARLPFIGIFKKNIFNTEYQILTSLSNAITSYLLFDGCTPGITYTSTLSVFPLLTTYNSLLDISTNLSYITGDQRTLETGVLPFVADIPYEIAQTEQPILTGNITLNYYTCSVSISNKSTVPTSIINATKVQGTTLTNQFNQNIITPLVLTASLKDQEFFTILDIESSNKDTIYLTIEVDEIQKTGKYYLLNEPDDQPDLPVLEFTPTKNTTIKITARPKNTLVTSFAEIPLTLELDQFITPSIYFNRFIPSWHSGVINPYLFEVAVWSDFSNIPTQLQLYVKGSKSYPYIKEKNRNKKLAPQWTFYDVNLNPTNFVPVENIILVNSTSNKPVGALGIARFYFKDDMPTGPEGEIIIVSPRTSEFVNPVDLEESQGNVSSFANSNQRATLFYYVNNINPDKLQITRDGTRDLKDYYWLGSKIPTTITLTTKQKYDQENIIDFSYPSTSNIQYPITLGVNNSSQTVFLTAPEAESNLFSISYENTGFSRFNDINNITTGFVKASITPLLTGEYTILAKTIIEPINQYVHTPYAYVCDNKNNLLTRIYTDPQYKVNRKDGIIKNAIEQQYFTMALPTITSLFVRPDGSTDFNLLTGESEATYIAVDGLYNVWVSDPHNDRVFKLSPQSETLVNLQFPDGTSPGPITIDSQQDVWITLVDDISAVKYSSTGQFLTSIVLPFEADDIGNPLYSPGGIDVDKDDNVWIAFFNSSSSFVCQFTQKGQLLKKIDMNPYLSPVEIVIDTYNTPWVLTEQTTLDTDYTIGGLHRIEQDQTYTTVLTGFQTPICFNIDNKNNAWIGIGDNFVVCHPLVVRPEQYITTKVYDLSNLYKKDLATISPILQTQKQTDFSTPYNIDLFFSETEQPLFIKTNENTNYVMLGTSEGLYFSRNYGDTWIKIQPNEYWKDGCISDSGKYQIAINQSSAQSNIKGVITKDHGLTWTILQYPQELINVAINATGNFICFISHNAAGTYNFITSTDYGKTLKHQSILPFNGLGGRFFITVSEENSMIIVGAIKDSTCSGLYMSIDLGVTWKALSLEDKWIDCVIFNNEGSAVVINDDKILTTFDKGKNWIIIEHSLTDIVNLNYSKINNAIVVATKDKLYTSVNTGDTFEEFHTFNDFTINQTVADSFNLNRYIMTESNELLKFIWKTKQADFQQINNLLSTQPANKTVSVAGLSNDQVIFINNFTSELIYCDHINEYILISRKRAKIYDSIPKKALFNDLQGINFWDVSDVGFSNSVFYTITGVDWPVKVISQGDWTGLRRNLKYCPVSLDPYVITGESAPISIKSQPSDIRLINDSYNLSESLTNMLPIFLKHGNFKNLTEKLLPGMIGTNETSYQTISRQFFEKIANFTINHADIDYNNISQLYNTFAMLNYSSNIPNIDYPPDISRLMDIFSISHKRLVGEKSNDMFKFTNNDVATSEDTLQTIELKKNISPVPIDSLEILNEGDTIVAYDVQTGEYTILYINKTTQARYISGYGLREPMFNFDAGVFNQYVLYRYKQNELPSYVDGIIDRNNPLNSSEYLTSDTEIFHQAKKTKIEELFNYYLSKGLGILSDK